MQRVTSLLPISRSKTASNSEQQSHTQQRDTVALVRVQVAVRPIPKDISPIHVHAQQVKDIGTDVS